MKKEDDVERGAERGMSDSGGELNGTDLSMPPPRPKVWSDNPFDGYSPSTYFTVWMLLNVGQAVLNKAVFATYKFPFPIFVSAGHMLVVAIVCNYTTFVKRWTEPKRLPLSILAPYSLLFMLNILVGNVSIKLVPLSFLQVVRACSPAFALVLEAAILGTRPHMAQVLTLLFVCFGIAVTVTGELAMNLTLFEVSFAIFGAALAALKGVMSKYFLSGDYNLPPDTLLANVAPLAFVEMLFMSAAMGEVGALSRQSSLYMSQFGTVTSVVVSCLLAYILNVTNNYTNKATSPVALAVGGNVKQAITILLSFVLFDDQLNFSKSVGIVITVVAAAMYSYVGIKLSAKNKSERK